MACILLGRALAKSELSASYHTESVVSQEGLTEGNRSGPCSRKGAVWVLAPMLDQTESVLLSLAESLIGCGNFPSVACHSE